MKVSQERIPASAHGSGVDVEPDRRDQPAVQGATKGDGHKTLRFDAMPLPCSLRCETRHVSSLEPNPCGGIGGAVSRWEAAHDVAVGQWA